MKSKAGKVFGGFISIPWKSYGGWASDNEAFIFSVDRLKVYPVIKQS